MEDTVEEVVERVAETTEVAKEEVIQPTLAEVEKQWQENEAKKRGPDFAKRFPGTVEVKVEDKKEESKTEAKSEDKKVDTPITPPKPKTGFGKVIRRAVNEATEPLLAKIRELETKIAPKVEDKKADTVLVEPKRDDFKTVEEWVAAVRRYDREVAKLDEQKAKTTKEADDARVFWDRRIESLNSEIAAFEKTHPDYKEVAAKAPLIGRKNDDEYNQLIGGILIVAGPEVMYELAKNPKMARTVSDIDSQQLIAVTNSDNSKGVILWLASHPDDVQKINGMNQVKAQAFVGRIEAKIEAEAEKADATKRASSGKDDTPHKVEKVIPATEVEAPKKVKPEPPPALKGQAPASVDDWRSPEVTNLKDFERLYMEDPKNKRR